MPTKAELEQELAEVREQLAQEQEQRKQDVTLMLRIHAITWSLLFRTRWTFHEQYKKRSRLKPLLRETEGVMLRGSALGYRYRDFLQDAINDTEAVTKLAEAMDFPMWEQAERIAEEEGAAASASAILDQVVVPEESKGGEAPG